MFLRFFIPLLFLGVSPLFASLSWETDLDASLKRASSEKKPVLVEFTGSTWCSPCKKFKEDVLDTEAFGNMEKDKYIIVEIDLPRAQGDSAQEMKARQWAERLKVAGVPTLVFFDEAGRPCAKSSGLIENVERMSQILGLWERNRGFRDNFFAEADGAKDDKKAEALAKAFSLLPAELIEAWYPDRVEELKKCDPGDKTEFFKNRRLEELKKKQLDELASLMSPGRAVSRISGGKFESKGKTVVLRQVWKVNFDGKEMTQEEALKAFAERESTLPELKQRALIQGDFSPRYLSGDLDGMLKSLDRIKAIAPEAPLGKWCEGMKEEMKKKFTKSDAVRMTTVE